MGLVAVFTAFSLFGGLPLVAGESPTKCPTIGGLCPTTETGGKCKPVCKSGFNVVGTDPNGEVTCTEGSWSGIPICEDPNLNKEEKEKDAKDDKDDDDEGRSHWQWIVALAVLFAFILFLAFLMPLCWRDEWFVGSSGNRIGEGEGPPGKAISIQEAQHLEGGRREKREEPVDANGNPLKKGAKQLGGAVNKMGDFVAGGVGKIVGN